MDKQGCDACEQELGVRMERFGRRRRILSGESLLRREFLARIERLFPEVFAYLSDPRRRLGEKTVDCGYNIEVVAAPLPFTASCVSHACPHCGHSTVVAVLNSRFQVACSHLLAVSMGSGLQTSELRRLFTALFREPLDLRSFSHPTQLPSRAVFSGLAWVLFHEYGHHVADARIDPLSLVELAPHLRIKAVDEINADRASADVLMHRSSAADPLDASRSTEVMLGIELVLRSAIAIEGLMRQRTGLLESSDETYASEASDVLRTRWRCLKEYGRMLDAQGMLCNWTETRELYFNRWDTMLSNLGGVNGLGTD